MCGEHQGSRTSSNFTTVVAGYPFALQVKNSMYRDATLTSAKVGFYWNGEPRVKGWSVRDITYEFLPLKAGRQFIVEADLVSRRAFGRYDPPSIRNCGATPCVHSHWIWRASPKTL